LDDLLLVCTAARGLATVEGTRTFLRACAALSNRGFGSVYVQTVWNRL